MTHGACKALLLGEGLRLNLVRQKVFGCIFEQEDEGRLAIVGALSHPDRDELSLARLLRLTRVFLRALCLHQRFHLVDEVYLSRRVAFLLSCKLSHNYFLNARVISKAVDVSDIVLLCRGVVELAGVNLSEAL